MDKWKREVIVLCHLRTDKNERHLAFFVPTLIMTYSPFRRSHLFHFFPSRRCFFLYFFQCLLLHKQLNQKPKLISKIGTGSQSFDFAIYNYNASILVGQSVFPVSKNCFYFKNTLRY
jgi:hypothetical protein